MSKLQLLLSEHQLRPLERYPDKVSNCRGSDMASIDLVDIHDSKRGICFCAKCDRRIMAVGMSVIGVSSRFVSDVPNPISLKSSAKILLQNCKSHNTNLLLLPISSNIGTILPKKSSHTMKSCLPLLSRSLIEALRMTVKCARLITSLVFHPYVSK